MASDFKRVVKTGKGKEHSFVRLPHYILKSDEFGGLQPNEVKLLFEFAKEYKGANNGNFSAAYSVLRNRGWRSAGTLAKAKQGLIDKGWVFCTRHGGSHHCSLYALTWWPLDECDGKIPYHAEKMARHSWQKNTLGSRNADRSSLYSDRSDEKGTK